MITCYNVAELYNKKILIMRVRENGTVADLLRYALDRQHSWVLGTIHNDRLSARSFEEAVCHI
jgi:hypothetical protein